MTRGQRLSPSPLMSNDEPCYAARRRRAQPSTPMGTGLREEPAVSSRQTAPRGMVAPRGMKPQELVFVRRRARFMKTQALLARAFMKHPPPRHFLICQPSSKSIRIPLTQTRPEEIRRV